MDKTTVNPDRSETDRFKKNLKVLIEQTDHNKSDEYHRRLVASFFEKTYHSAKHFINSNEEDTLVLNTFADKKVSSGVLIEVKKPENKTKLFETGNINSKAFHDLLFKFLQERINRKNDNLKNLIITNIYEWYIFEAGALEKTFMQNKELIKQFQNFEKEESENTISAFFNKDRIKTFIEDVIQNVNYTYIDTRECYKAILDKKNKSNKIFYPIFKLLSPLQLLKLRVDIDSNRINRKFYNELMHIIGLVEFKKARNVFIERINPENKGYLLENIIDKLDKSGKIKELEMSEIEGSDYSEKLYNVAVELVLTWINRVLFFKFLETGPVSYGNDKEEFSFLNIKKISTFENLNKLFFEVLSVEYKKRTSEINNKFINVPFLNSSLFKPTELEKSFLYISQLENNKTIPIRKRTVLKDSAGIKKTGEINTLHYLFEFIDSFDFSRKENTQEDAKTYIKSSIQGLLYEKINRNKEGSIFTPGFLTMYMCRESIRRTIVQKFNDIKGWKCKTIDNTKAKITNTKEANDIINSIKICDPAVGSGHFLVSALNEIIVIKSELGILQDIDTIKEYNIKIINDELFITDKDGKQFRYDPTNEESQSIQKKLFSEKQIIIKNCLYGVDINSESVKLCCQRLWLELLKNAYYKKNDSSNCLCSLPDLESNIKCGNSLVSNFKLNNTDENENDENETDLNSNQYDIFDWDSEFPTLLNEKGQFIGFDIIIGNPPYIQIQYSNYSFEAYLAKYEVFEKRGDFYSLFYELGINILKPNGIISFITSDRFCVTKSGKKIRNYLSKYKFISLIKFKDITLFSDTNVDALISIIKKEECNNNKFKQFELKDLKSAKNVQVISNLCTQKVDQKYFKAEPWSFEDNNILKLKEKLKSRGVPLKKIEDLEIHRGLTTAANSVFLIDKIKGDELIKLNPASKEILKPVLRGAEIKRFHINKFSNYIILNKPGVEIDRYPEIYEYLKEHKEKLLNIFSVKKGSNKWFELSACRFYDSFKEEKLMWSRLSRINSFAISTKKEYAIDSASFATGRNLKYYSAILNSKVVLFYYKLSSILWGKHSILWFGDHFDNIPIPKGNNRDIKTIEEIVSKILSVKKQKPKTDTSDLEKEIDQIVYKLYKLNDEEIKIIENRTIEA